MCSYFKTASWIWISDNSGADEYGEFSARFSAQGAPAVCRVSCDGDYTLFINGEYAACNQYGDYEHYKIFDEIDITEHLHAGINEISLLVWHFGQDTQRTEKRGQLLSDRSWGGDRRSAHLGFRLRKTAKHPRGVGRGLTERSCPQTNRQSGFQL